MKKRNLIPTVIFALFAFLCVIPGPDATAQLPWPQVTFQQATPSALDEEASLIVTSPDQGEVVDLIRDCDTCPAFIEFDATLMGFELAALSDGSFPCEPQLLCDTCRWKGNGQHIYIVVDDSPYRRVTDLNAPAHIPVKSPTPGAHTLRVFMSRSWDESLKNTTSVSSLRETYLYAVRTFYIDSSDGTHAVDSTLPLLTTNSPLDTSEYKYPKDSVLFDFYMMFKGLSDGYRVEVTVFDSTMQNIGQDTLDVWAPHCIEGLEEPPVGRLRKYFIKARLIDTSGNPVQNGPGNFNIRQWAFWIRRS